MHPLRLSLQFALGSDAALHRAALPRHQVSRWIRHALDEDAQITVRLVDTDEGRALNRDYRHKDSATNVLSFPNMDDAEMAAPEGLPRLLGDVVLARETIAREAEAQGKGLADHTIHLLVHGTLHLLGYDHLEAAAAAEMEALEVEILAGLGIADPYADDVAAAGAQHG
jgi:probable rRNA maturation factor